ncbi:hypothetical protein PR202_gb13838 [Eleusine coracana subsp. coracana]|uniref:Uncharacterized protein n=1 Tax=Eleusine coracana subsp. coracana TaxID=191504 RepID=A0AAV5ER94_ELECO|nr:hypothetical protein QOZ80_4BG0329200 [Eleusine coracana subsp. coracana]GJN25949.1 hypothetical protein PR202_gb13838 [Eleusine coracana subsp. coracana]
MPDSSSAATSIGRSLRRDFTHPADHNASSDLEEADAFQRHAADLLNDLLTPDLLSLAWTSRLLDSFLLCLEQFRALLFGSGAAAAARPPLDRLVADFFERAVKALDLCNAVRDGLDLVRQWRNHLAIAARVLASDAALGEAQIRRARKALTDLTILMLDDNRDGGVVGQRNRSFGRANKEPRPQQGQGHHRRTSSGGSSSGSGSTNHLRSLSWSVSRAWSAARQLQAIGGGLPVPRPSDIAATGGLASAVYTMSAVLFIVAWALVAAIPCQDRGLQAHFSVPRNFPWSGPVITLYERILEESKRKDRKNSYGLLKEIHQIELCSRHLMEITDTADFPLPEDKDVEVREAAQDLVLVCGSLKDGIDPLERQVREMFHRIVRTRTEILDCLSKPNGTE